MTESRKRAIIILGMHRSGTSMISGMLNFLGFDIGQNIVPPAEDNPKGFFENSEITLFNDRLLENLYTRWDQTLFIPEDWWNEGSFRQFKNELKNIISDEYSDSLNILFKDPRLCVLLPFYKQVFSELSIILQFILIFRNPLEIASSLSKRNNLSYEQSALLWMDYMLKAEYYTRNQERIFIYYVDLLKDPIKVLGSVAKKFKLVISLDSTVDEQIKSFVEPQLKHHHADDSMLESDECPGVSQLFLTFRENKNVDLSSKSVRNVELIKKKFYNRVKFFNGISSDYEATLYIELVSGKQFLLKHNVSTGRNQLSFMLENQENIIKLRFRPCNTRAGLQINSLKLTDDKNELIDIHDWNSNSAWKNENGYMIFETEFPEIEIKLQSPNKLQRVSIDLFYYAFGNATYSMHLITKDIAINQMSTQIKAKDQEIEIKRLEINEKDEFVRIHESNLRNASEHILEKERLIKEKEDVIRIQEVNLKDAAENTRELDRQSKENLGLINEQIKVIIEQGTLLNENGSLIKEKEGQLLENEEKLNQLKSRIENQEVQIRQIFDSYSWKTGKFILSPAIFIYTKIILPFRNVIFRKSI